MINDNTILSSFDDKPTLLEWLKKVEDALKTDTATAVSVENPSANTYVFKITFADGETLSSGNVVFPDSVKDVSIKNGHIIVTSVGGNVEDLGVLNPYAGTIVVNAETNTTEIYGKLQVTGNVATGGNLGVTGQAVVGSGLSVNGALGVTGNATIGGRLQADSSIISNGEIRGGNISGTKFLLGTEEMPMVKANPTDEATATLEKVKIGDVAYKVGGSENDRELTLIMPYPRSTSTTKKEITIEDEELWNKLKDYYFETIKIYYNDGYPLGIFTINYYYSSDGSFSEKQYTCLMKSREAQTMETWYGKQFTRYGSSKLKFNETASSKKVAITYLDNYFDRFPMQSKFDDLYKLADKPTQDGNYILKASVSGGVVSYTWELQQ